MAPKKVNWDLKRDIQGKLDRLERRTQRSLVELLRERLEKEAEDVGDGYAALD
jgi:coiled-coil domain-containing protein 12